MSRQLERPIVSVLVTVFNREAYLSDCLESILASSWKDFEVVVVDDCSVDDSHAVAERHSVGDSRIRPYRNDRNLGDYPNRMRAASLATGRYIKYVDSDDLIHPHGLGVMVEAMEKHPQAALALSHSLPEDREPYPSMLSPRDAWIRQFLGDGCLNSGPTGAIIRRDAFIEAGGFRDWGVLSDMDLWYRMAARWPVLLLQPGLVWWRRHDDQEFTKGGASMVYLEKGYQLMMESLASSDSPLTPSERKAAEFRERQHQARRLISLAVRRGSPLLALRSFNRSGLSAADLVQGLRPYR